MKSLANRNTLVLGAVWLVLLLGCFTLGIRKADAVPAACVQCSCKKLMTWWLVSAQYGTFYSGTKTAIPEGTAMVQCNVLDDCTNFSHLNTTGSYDKYQVTPTGNFNCNPPPNTPLVTEVIAAPNNMVAVGGASPGNLQDCVAP